MLSKVGSASSKIERKRVNTPAVDNIPQLVPREERWQQRAQTSGLREQALDVPRARRRGPGRRLIVVEHGGVNGGGRRRGGERKLRRESLNRAAAAERADQRRFRRVAGKRGAVRVARRGRREYCICACLLEPRSDLGWTDRVLGDPRYLNSLLRASRIVPLRAPTFGHGG